jgi:ABC-type transport system substrate-binding protein
MELIEIMTHRKYSRFTASVFALGIGMSLSFFSGCTKKNQLDPTNTFYTFSIAKIKGLDPIFSDDIYSAIEAARVYETLLQYSYLKRPYALEPCLAESMPTISKDGKTYTFKLKKGVVFQDDKAFKASAGKGRELVADDFIYSFKRLADPKLNSPQWWLLDGKIVGLNQWRDAQAKNAKTDYSAAIPGLKALDSHTLEIKLTVRSYQFIYALAMVSTAAVAKEVVDEYGPEFLNHPVGTGPFKLAEYNPQAKIVYVKNPTFRKELFPADGADAEMAADVGKPLPLLDKIVMTVYVESQPQWLNFMQGNLDVSSIPKDNFSEAIDKKTGELSAELKKKGIVLAKDTMLDVTHTSFNMMDPLVGKNKYLRQAISMAVNTEEEIQLFYNGRAISAQGPIPPGMNGYDPALKNPYKVFNVAKAKELLKKAGYPDGKGLPPLEFLSLADTNTRQMTEYFQKSLEAIGIKLKVQTYSWPEFQASIKNKKGQLWGYAWQGDYPDAENFLQMFYGKNISPGANDSNYVNPEYDRLYEKALTLPDSPARTALYKKMAAIVMEDTPWVFGLHRLNYTLKYKWVKDYRYHEFPYGMSKYYRIDTALRK